MAEIFRWREITRRTILILSDIPTELFFSSSDSDYLQWRHDISSSHFNLRNSTLEAPSQVPLVLLWFAIENKKLHGQDFCNKLRTSWSVTWQYSRSFCVYNQIKSKLYTQKLLEYCNVTDQLVRSLLQKSWPCRVLFSVGPQSAPSGDPPSRWCEHAHSARQGGDL